MAQEDEKFQLGERCFVSFVIGHANLSEKDRALVLSSAKNMMTEAEITPYLSPSLPCRFFAVARSSRRSRPCFMICA